MSERARKNLIGVVRRRGPLSSKTCGYTERIIGPNNIGERPTTSTFTCVLPRGHRSDHGDGWRTKREK